jgi:hypothetical protein
MTEGRGIVIERTTVRATTKIPQVVRELGNDQRSQRKPQTVPRRKGGSVHLGVISNLWVKGERRQAPGGQMSVSGKTANGVYAQVTIQNFSYFELEYWSTHRPWCG